MTTTKKATKRENFETLLTIPAVAENAALVAFINHELELLAKKNSAEHKPTAKQNENASIKSAIVDEMEDNRLYTISEMIKEFPSCAEFTNQRVSALVRQLVADGKVERIEEKRKAYFRKIAD